MGLTFQNTLYQSILFVGISSLLSGTDEYLSKSIQKAQDCSRISMFSIDYYIVVVSSTTILYLQISDDHRKLNLFATI